MVEAAITHPAAASQDRVVSALGLEHSSTEKPGAKAIAWCHIFLIKKIRSM